MIKTIKKTKLKDRKTLILGIQKKYFVQIWDKKGFIREPIVSSTKADALRVYNFLKRKTKSGKRKNNKL